jgi:hypothetical protein
VEDERFPVQVRYYGTASFTELAPMLDELHTRFGRVSAVVQTPEPHPSLPPRGGGGYPLSLELAFNLHTIGGFVLAGAALYAGGVLTELGKQDAKALRQKLLKVSVLGKPPPEILRPFALSLKVGTVQFYIDGPMTEEEFASALQLATALVAKLPDERVNHPRRNSGWPVTWDSSSQSWNDPLNP